MAIKVAFDLIQREACKASIMIEGLTGKGKSGLAILLGYALCGGFDPTKTPEEKAAAWKEIFAADAENRSLNLFVGVPGSFGERYNSIYGCQLTAEDGYAPSNYLAIREEAIKKGCKAFIADSITHMWTAKGGVLDLVNEIKNKNPKMDNYRVWGVPEVSDEKQKLIDVIRDHRCHVITTVRVKEKFDMQFDANKNSNSVVSIGEQQLQQEGLKYEPDLVLHMLKPGKVSGDEVQHPVAKVIKSRYAILSEGEEYVFTPELCEQLRAYLATGIDPAILLEQQRQDYIEAVKDILNSNASANAIWKVLKADAGHADTKLADIPLTALKRLYTQINAS